MLITEEARGTTEGTGEFVDWGLRWPRSLGYLLGNLGSLRSLLGEGWDLGLLRLWSLRNLLGDLRLHRSLTDLRGLQRNLKWTLRWCTLVEVGGRFIEW